MDARTIDIASQRIMNAAQLMAEIEAMKAANAEREREGLAPAYGEDAFRKAMIQWQW
jgi:hypothetical protein